jgi:[glutamine synthetase] adenylyltransferase / [glutamine synthetase]-adenylyl-L-tyrosine phosphorylase
MDEVLDSDLLGSIASMPVPQDLLKRLQAQLQSLLPQTADPAVVTARLQRFIAASRSPTSLLAFFERDDSALATLLRLLGTGNRLANQLIADPESFDLVRASGAADVRREVLVDEIIGELEAVAACGGGAASAAWVLRSVAGRERLRIAYAEFVGGAAPSRVSAQLTVLAEAILEAALQFTSDQMGSRYGVPRTPSGEAGRLSVIGLGALGGSELGYDTPLEVMFLCDLCGPSDGAVNLPGEDYFGQLCSRMVALVRGESFQDADTPDHPTRLTAEGTADDPEDAAQTDSGDRPELNGPLFDVSLSRRPLGGAGPLVMTSTEAHRHYQLSGRTWERMLHLKSRVVAGDNELGDRFLELIHPWVYRKYLQRADQEGLHTLMRKLSRRLTLDSPAGTSPDGVAVEGGSDDQSQQPPALRGNQDGAAAVLDVRHRVGGLDDIETIVGLLQIINGADLATVRVREILAAIQALLEASCLTVQEAALLNEHYQFLKRYEHCRQVDSGGDFGELRPPDQESHDCNPVVAAWNLGYRQPDGKGNAAELLKAIDVACGLNRQTIQRLLQDADDGNKEFVEDLAIETELVLDPEPDAAIVSKVMFSHGMRDAELAMDDLQRLANEPVPFLSSRRCRHFLASIAPSLLREVGQTPDPHETLSTLAEVSDSLGGKAVLWELFGSSPPALRLFVRLCGCSPYLTNILIRHPGMIDDLIDSLILDRLPSDAWLEASSTELCRSAMDIRSILQSFKNGAHLQIGVRDCLGKESLEATHAALAATAECILRRTSEAVQRDLADQYGDPITPDGEAVELVILALGKLGAREPNYHSDTEVLFLYTADCQTQRRVGGHRNTTSTSKFFSEVALRTASLINETGSSETGFHDPRLSEGTLIHTAAGDSKLREMEQRETEQSDVGLDEDAAHGGGDRAASHRGAVAQNRLLQLGTFEISRSTTGQTVAVSLESLANYFRRGQASLVQRLALCKARAVSGSAQTRRKVDALVRELIISGEWFPMMATQINELRLAMETSAGGDNLKRAAGGTVDVELITQTLQLCHGRKHPDILVPGTMDALSRVSDAGLIDPAMAEALRINYRTLREVESKLRLLDTPRRHEIPSDSLSLKRLAFLMGRDDAEPIVSLCREIRASNRRMFNHLIRELS